MWSRLTQKEMHLINDDDSKDNNTNTTTTTKDIFLESLIYMKHYKYL
jgi:hypothetical protein